MSLFIESMRVEPDGSVPLLSYHQARVSTTLNDFDQNTKNTLLEEFQKRLQKLLQNGPSNCIRKYRVIYSIKGIKEAYLTTYSIRPIATLTFTSITFDYSHKFADRININSAYHQHPATDDILMIKDGFLTDTSYGNIALYDGGDWYTPETPLLAGCRRQYLIDNGQILTKKIRIEEMNSYSYLMIFNALIPFGRILIPTQSLHLDSNL